MSDQWVVFIHTADVGMDKRWDLADVPPPWLIQARESWQARLSTQPRFALDNVHDEEFMGMIVGGWLRWLSFGEDTSFVLFLPSLCPPGDHDALCTCYFKHYLLDLDRSSAPMSTRRGRHGLTLEPVDRVPVPVCSQCQKRFAHEALVPFAELNQHMHESTTYMHTLRTVQQRFDTLAIRSWHGHHLSDSPLLSTRLSLVRVEHLPRLRHRVDDIRNTLDACLAKVPPHRILPYTTRGLDALFNDFAHPNSDLDVAMHREWLYVVIAGSCDPGLRITGGPMWLVVRHAAVRVEASPEVETLWAVGHTTLVDEGTVHVHGEWVLLVLPASRSEGTQIHVTLTTPESLCFVRGSPGRMTWQGQPMALEPCTTSNPYMSSVYRCPVGTTTPRRLSQSCDGRLDHVLGTDIMGYTRSFDTDLSFFDDELPNNDASRDLLAVTLARDKTLIDIRATLAKMPGMFLSRVGRDDLVLIFDETHIYRLVYPAERKRWRRGKIWKLHGKEWWLEPVEKPRKWREWLTEALDTPDLVTHLKQKSGMTEAGWTVPQLLPAVPEEDAMDVVVASPTSLHYST